MAIFTNILFFIVAGEEGAAGDQGKEGGDFHSDATDSTADVGASSSKKRGSDEEDEEESSTAEEEDDSNTGNKRVRLNSNGSSVAVTDNNNKVTVSVDKDNDNLAVTEEAICEGREDDEEPHRQHHQHHQENNLKSEVNYRQALTPTSPVTSHSPLICIPLQLQTTPLPLSVDDQQRHLHKEPEVMEEIAQSSENEETQDGPLDFSVKRKSVSPKPTTPKLLKEEMAIQSDVDAPLDLSVTSSRKRPLDNNTSNHHQHHVGILQHVNAHLGHVVGNRNKNLRLDSSSKTSSPWSNQFPFRFSPSSSPNSSVEIPLWNGGVKTSGVSGSGSTVDAVGVGGSRSTPSPSNSSEISQRNHTIARDPSPKTSSTNATSSGRHNAWQSHWLSRGAEQAKDVLKCVWCRKSFRSLEEMTTHMKEARHCGMHLHHQTSLPPPLPPPPPPSSSHHHQQQQQQQQQIAKNSSINLQKKLNGDDVSKDSSSSVTGTTLPMPRKLVRGQDVWLGKGAEQTKQILKCMWCGQSFKTLAEMTTHMQQTQHYTNIISQEQIISWKSPEDKMMPSGQSHVNAVLTCKVCDQAFSSLKELSNHMVKNSHYKEHILRSITENGGRRRQTREKRKKSLPVKKLLELERAQNEISRVQPQTTTPTTPESEHSRVPAKVINQTTSSEPNGRISCEKCGRKIDTQLFVEHIRQCVGSGTASSGATSGSISSLSTLIASVSPKSDKRSSSPRKSDASSPRQSHKQNYASPILQPSPTSSESNGQHLDSVMISHNNSEAPSVLNAIERLIEKSFDGKQQSNRSGNRHYVTNAPGSNRTTPSSSSTPAPIVQSLSDFLKPDDDEHHRDKSGSESESDVNEMEEETGYDKLVIDESSTAKEKVIKQKRKKLRQRSSSYVNRLSSPSDVGRVDVQRVSGSAGSVRASPLSTGSRRDMCSPNRSLDSPGSCSNCSSHTGIIERGGSAGGNSNVATSALSLVRSTPSPSEPIDHPLKELQKLLDKTNVSLTKSSSSASVVREALSPSASVAIGQALSPGSSASGLLSYASGGWGESSSATNAAGSDSVIYCNFCDNSFVSRSAFRHHMAKVHAVPAKDVSRLIASSSSLTVTALNMSTSGCVRISSPSASSSSSTSSSSAISPSSNNVNNNNNNNNNNLCKSPAKNNNTSSTSSSAANAATAPAPDESPHSKFLKYTELAKQLSSKYV